MNEKIKLILLFLALFLEIDLYANQSSTPLTLSEGKSALLLGAGVMRHENETNMLPLCNIEYGITDNFSINLLGLKYRLLDDNYPVELAVGAGFGTIEFGIGENEKFLKISTLEYILAKQRFTRNFFALYSLYFEKLLYDSGKSEYMEIKSGINLNYCFTEKFHSGFSFGYKMIDDTMTYHMDYSGIAAGYAFSENWIVNSQFEINNLAAGYFNDKNPYDKDIKIILSLMYQN